jgi:hypothetical protein
MKMEVNKEDVVEKLLNKRIAQIIAKRRMKKRRRVRRQSISYESTSWGRLLRDPYIGMSDSSSGKTFRYHVTDFILSNL